MGYIYISWPCYQRLWGNFLSVIFLMQLLYLVSHLVKEACSYGRGGLANITSSVCVLGT